MGGGGEKTHKETRLFQTVGGPGKEIKQGHVRAMGVEERTNVFKYAKYFRYSGMI